MSQRFTPKEEEERQKSRLLLQILYDYTPTRKDVELLSKADVERIWEQLKPLRPSVATKAGRGKNNKHNAVLKVMALFEKKADMEA